MFPSTAKYRCVNLSSDPTIPFWMLGWFLQGCNFITDTELAYRQGGASGCNIAWYLDSDGDGVGGSVSLLACEAPGKAYVSETGDCDDGNPLISPLVVEDCRTVTDEDCDGTPNARDPEMVPPSDCIEWFADRDGDGFGDDVDVHCDCAAEGVYVLREGGDCYDQLTTVNPSNSEICGDGFDNDCDGTANGCGYRSTFEFSEAPVILGDSAQAYAGTNVAMGPILPDQHEAILVLSDGTAGGKGQIDIFDAVTVVEAEGPLTTSAYSSRIVGEMNSDFGHVLLATHSILGSSDADVIVADPSWRSDEGNTVGKVYVFEGPIRGEINASDAGYVLLGSMGEDGFAQSLTVVEQQLYVGAPTSDLMASDAGAVYGYDTSGQPRSTWTGSEPSMYFGAALSRAADVNGDGLSDLVVGAYGANGGKGAAYIFWSANQRGDLTTEDADVAWNGLIVDEQVGRKVEIVGDITGDGYNDVLISAPNANRAYIVSASEEGRSLVDEASVKLFGSSDSGLGSAVVYVGDFNGDQHADVVLGGFVASQVNIVYGPLYGSYSAQNLGDMVILENRGNDQLGWSLAGGRDLNADGIGDLLVGARIASEGFSQNGAVYLLKGVGL